MKPQRDLYQVSLKILLKGKEGKILILKAVGNGRFAGFYDLPGGRIHTDEFLPPLEKIIGREIKEEVGDIKYNLRLVPVAIARDGPPVEGDYEPGKVLRILYVLFEADYLDGEIKISPEHTDYRWVDLSKEKIETLFTPEILEGVRIYLAANKLLKQ